MATKEDSLAAIKSYFEDEPPTQEDILRGNDTPHTFARGMIDLHLALFPYNGAKDWDDLRAEVWEEVFPTPERDAAEILADAVLDAVDVDEHNDIVADANAVRATIIEKVRELLAAQS